MLSEIFRHVPLPPRSEHSLGDHASLRQASKLFRATSDQTHPDIDGRILSSLVKNFLQGTNPNIGTDLRRGLKKTKILNLDNYLIGNDPVKLQKLLRVLDLMPNLSELFLDGCHLGDAILSGISNESLRSLQVLDLSHNLLSTAAVNGFPFSKLVKLKKLMLTDNQLAALPESIGRLGALTQLWLNGNQLTALPEGIGRLAALTRLGLRNNQLTALPESIGRLAVLTFLGLNGNQLTALPESIGRLAALTQLALSNNQLTTLPESFGQLGALIRLGLDGNQIMALPES